MASGPSTTAPAHAFGFLSDGEDMCVEADTLAKPTRGKGTDDARLDRILDALVAEKDDHRHAGADFQLLREGLQLAHIIVRREW